MHVLIVEDDPSIAETLEQYIQAEFGLACEIANTNAGAVDSVKKSKPALILLDYLLPDGACDGIISYCKTLENPPPIILMSAAGALAQECAKRYRLHYLAKPFDLDAFTELIKKFLTD